MDKWLKFYAPFFNNLDEANQFISSCEPLSPSGNVAKVMMHQCQRLITLSDDLKNIRPYDDQLNVLILIMCSENIAKLHDNYHGESHSWKFVKKFFTEFVSENDKNQLKNGIENNKDNWHRPLSYDDVIDMLYKIRCDVVHEGNYSSFYFYDGKNHMLVFAGKYVVTPTISLNNFRGIIIRGCINAVKDKLNIATS